MEATDPSRAAQLKQNETRLETELKRVDALLAKRKGEISMHQAQVPSAGKGKVRAAAEAAAKKASDEGSFDVKSLEGYRAALEKAEERNRKEQDLQRAFDQSLEESGRARAERSRARQEWNSALEDRETEETRLGRWGSVAADMLPTGLLSNIHELREKSESTYGKLESLVNAERNRMTQRENLAKQMRNLYPQGAMRDAEPDAVCIECIKTEAHMPETLLRAMEVPDGGGYEEKGSGVANDFAFEDFEMKANKNGKTFCTGFTLGIALTRTIHERDACRQSVGWREVQRYAFGANLAS